MSLAVVGLFALAIGAYITGTGASIHTQGIVVFSTLGGITLPMTLAVVSVRGVRKYLDSQKERLQDGLTGERLFEGLREAFRTDSEQAVFHKPELDQLTDAQWTRLVIALNEHFSQNEPKEHEKKMLDFIGSFDPSHLADNLFFIGETAMDRILDCISDKKPFQAAIKGKLDFLDRIYKDDYQAPFRDIHCYFIFLGKLSTLFGGAKPTWHRLLSSKERKAQQQTCNQGMHNLSKTLLKIVPDNMKAENLLQMWKKNTFN